MNPQKTSPPPPPLPPPPAPLLQEPSKSRNETIRGLIHYKKNQKDEFDDTCKRILSYSSNFMNNIFYHKYQYLKPQLQNGPNCGLVALSIATSILENFITAEELLIKAIENGYTKQGEMFSAENLLSLVKELTDFEAFMLKNCLSSHINCILNCLTNGGLLLVPYDSDFNNTPCCKMGHCAHWAVISGFVIFKIDSQESEIEDDSVFLKFSSSQSLCSCFGADEIMNELELSENDEHIVVRKLNQDDLQKLDDKSNDISKMREGKIYLAGRQGKSKHLGLWSFEDLSLSNDNLVSFSPSRVSSEYVLPVGGVEEGLKGKSILLKRPSCKS